MEIAGSSIPVSFINIIHALGGFSLAILILGAGIFLTVRCRFYQVRGFFSIICSIFQELHPCHKKKMSAGDITPFQALTTALAATVGTGNIAGVATALAAGGPGAVFWMWVSAFFGMMLKFSEIALAVFYRRQGREGVAGGPMYVLSDGLNWRGWGMIYALFGALAAFGTGNMVQAHTVTEALKVTLEIPSDITAAVLAVITAVVILGGIHRIGVWTSRLVPAMTVLYVGGLLIIIVMHRHLLVEALQIIVESAFCETAAAGGFAGAGVALAVRYGVTRGIFTNEAGLGSAAIAHAAARTSHPVKQGTWGILEVFIDTHLLCTLTALALIVTGAWTTGLEGAPMTVEAFNRGLPGSGGVVVAAGLIFFSFSTLISWFYYGERCYRFIFPSGSNYYRYFWIVFIIIGARGGLQAVWAWADTLNALMALPNLLALLALSGTVAGLLRSYYRK